MVLGYHLIFSNYGFWMPNDPRGSWSTYVASRALYEAGGKATKTTERCSLAGRPHDRAARLAVKSALPRPPVRFDEPQRAAVAGGYADYIRRSGLPVWACAVLPDHSHFVTGRFRRLIEAVAAQLKAAATRRLIDTGLHPCLHLRNGDDTPPACFAEGQWKVFLNTPAAVAGRIRYVEGNPLKDGLPPQRWPFVVPCPLLAPRPFSRPSQTGAAAPTRGAPARPSATDG